MQSARWYLKRLSLMSGGELLWRVQQSLRGRVARPETSAVVPARIDTPRLTPWRASSGAEVAPASYVRAADRILAGEVDLFGQWRSLKAFADPWNTDPESGTRAPLTRGDRLDYRSASLVGSARNVWEINRHFQLVALAQAALLTKDSRYSSAAVDMVEAWLRACPYPLGLNWVSALEHGIRLVNWYITARLLRASHGSFEMSTAWLDSIHQHCAFIWAHQSRYSSANNHLIGEMAGLYVASCAWPCWERSSHWRKDAKRILEREMQLQVHADGVSREQTVGYQFFVLQFAILAGLVGESTDEPFSREFWQKVRAMIGFVRSIADAGGALPDFGDSDEGMAYVLSPAARTRRLQDMHDVEDALSSGQDRVWTPGSLAGWLVDAFPRPANFPIEAPEERCTFPEGGYFVLARNSGKADEVKAVFDAGPLGYLSIAAHGHADCLSFTLSLSGEQILVDPGTYCYHTEPEWRDYFRGTSAHNTARVDSRDQSEIAGPFMWTHKASPHVESIALGGPALEIRASHDGYHRLPDPTDHARAIRFDTNTDVIDVQDRFTCRREHLVERFWHFSEHCTARVLDERTIEILGRKVRLILSSIEKCDLQILRASESPRGGWISRNFGSLAATTTVVMTNRIAGAATLTTTLRWS